MQAAGSFTLIAAFVGIATLAIALGVIIAAPIVAVPFFVLGFAVFLFWRGKRRADVTLSERAGTHVPSTEEAAADPVGDSGVAAAAGSGAASRRHARAPGS